MFDRVHGERRCDSETSSYERNEDHAPYAGCYARDRLLDPLPQFGTQLQFKSELLLNRFKRPYRIVQLLVFYGQRVPLKPCHFEKALGGGSFHQNR